MNTQNPSDAGESHHHHEPKLEPFLVMAAAFDESESPWRGNGLDDRNWDAAYPIYKIVWAQSEADALEQGEQFAAWFGKTSMSWCGNEIEALENPEDLSPDDVRQLLVNNGYLISNVVVEPLGQLLAQSKGEAKSPFGMANASGEQCD